MNAAYNLEVIQVLSTITRNKILCKCIFKNVILFLCTCLECNAFKGLEILGYEFAVSDVWLIQV
jgi:hypothetical protein